MLAQQRNAFLHLIAITECNVFESKEEVGRDESAKRERKDTSVKSIVSNLI